MDVEDVAAAAQLVARAPALLGYDPETVAEKLRTLREYFVGVDVSTMVRRQPSLLLRDVDIAVPLKLGVSKYTGDGGIDLPLCLCPVRDSSRGLGCVDVPPTHPSNERTNE